MLVLSSITYLQMRQLNYYHSSLHTFMRLINYIWGSKFCLFSSVLKLDRWFAYPHLKLMIWAEYYLINLRTLYICNLNHTIVVGVSFQWVYWEEIESKRVAINWARLRCLLPTKTTVYSSKIWP